MIPSIVAEVSDDMAEGFFQEWMKDPANLVAWEAFVRCQNDFISEIEE